MRWSSSARAASGSSPVSEQLGEAVGPERCRRAVPGREHHAARGPPRAGGRRTAARPRWRGRASARRRRRTARVLSSAAAVSIDRVATADQERLDRGPVLLAERDPQRPGLRGGELVTQPHHRAQQPVQRRERQAAPRPRAPGCAAPVAVRGRRTSSSSRADLPTPGSPRTTTLPADPCRACSTSSARCAALCSRPTSTRRPYYRADAAAAAATRRFDRGDDSRTRARLRQPSDAPARIDQHAPRTPGGTHATPPSTRLSVDPERSRAAPHRAAALRRRRGAGRRRPLGGARLLDAAAPGGRLDHLLPVCRTARTSSAPRTSSWAPTTRLDDAPALDVLIHPGGPGTRRLLRDPDHLDWVRAQRATVPLMASVCTGSLVYAAAGLLTRSAGDHALGVAEPALRARPHRHHRRRRTVRRRRRPHHQRRRQRRHRHGPAPGRPIRRHRTRPRGAARHPVRPAPAGLTTFRPNIRDRHSHPESAPWEAAS